jgi:phospholipid N-methyltransferase
MERCRLAMLALADAWDKGTLPPILTDVKTKDQIYTLVRHGTNSAGHYNIYSTNEFVDKSEAGKALQELFTSFMGEADKKRQEESKKQQELDRLLDRVRYAQIPGFFPTPAGLADKLIKAAKIEAGNTILEPSAGIGSLLDALQRFPLDYMGGLTIVEVNRTLADILQAKGYTVNCVDFLEFTGQTFDRIIMNPPFENMQDVDHVRHAYELLNDGGVLVAITSMSWTFRSDNKAQQFREFLSFVGAEVENIPAGAFSGAAAFRSTGVVSNMVTIRKGTT